jgi:hypothetical protein
MPLDSARATAKSFVFEEIKKGYVRDPAQKAYGWQEKNFTFTKPDQQFLNGIEPFEEVIEVELKQTGGGYYDVYLKRTDSGFGNYITSVGHIKRGP